MGLFIRKEKKENWLLDENHKVVEAFKLGGTTYYHFDDSYKIPSGRALAALTFYEELQMNCDQDYLEQHCKASEKVFNNPRSINIGTIIILNNNLKERRNLPPFPLHIYNLASVLFFTKDESPYNYDFKSNRGKIETFRNHGEDFFAKIRATETMSFLNLPENNLTSYFHVSEQIDKLHRDTLKGILSDLQ